ncbi:MAG: peptidase M28, partial [Flavobacteriaceae bacterium]|nr:peptidase M28 [Flavobacteriaceae bacterium]
NGYYYIASAIFLSLSICFLIYHKFGTPEKQAEDFIFPLFFWLLICVLTAFYLKGAAYFIIPVYFGVLQLLVMLRQKSPNPFLMLLLSLPALVLLLPFVTTFPVALGLKILFVAAILTVFLFVFFLPVFGYFKRKNALGLLFFLLFNIIFITAHFKSGFNEERPKPNSLVYLLDTDAQKATWNSYDNLIDPWTQNYFGEDPAVIPSAKDGFSSKYGSGFTFKSEAPIVDIPEPGIVFKKLNTSDSLENINRYSLKIAPNRKINRMELFVDRSFNFEEFKVNGLEADSVYLGANPFHVFTKRWLDRLLIYHAANRDTLRLEFAVKGEKLPEFRLYEASYDLLENEKLKVPGREKTMIPRPFVLNDAVILKKTIRLEESPK